MNTTKEKSTTAYVLGIISLIIAILSVILSFIPYVGLFSFVTGSIALILSIISYFFAYPTQSKVMILAAFIVSVFSLIFTYIQYQEIKNNTMHKLEEITDDIDELKEMESLDSLGVHYDDMKQRLDSI